MAAHPPAPSPIAETLPGRPVEQLTRPLVRFLHIQSASGIVLLAATALALGLANSPAAGWYHAVWHTPVRLEVGGFRLAGDLAHLVVNDVLMTVFFFVVGLEIKRELVTGELRDRRKAALPVIAAAGGMLVPAGIYLAVIGPRGAGPEFRGWGVPMATDIAFVVGVMALLGRRVPPGLKVTLLSLAIADDIGAVVVIAAFYSTNLSWPMLGLAAAGLAAVYALNRVGVRSITVYVLVGAGVWLAVLAAGVHPTVAGVLLGLMTPAEPWVRREALGLALADLQGQLRAGGPGDLGTHDLQLLSFAAREAIAPLERLETALHPWVGFVIMPLFALANAGVPIDPGGLTSPVAVAVALGLFVGKPVGVVGFAAVAVAAGVARLPDGVGWRALVGGGCLAGIGFTMSLFIAGLALAGPGLAAGKVGTLMGSVASAAVGTAVLLWPRRGGDQAPGRFDNRPAGA